MPHFYGVRWGRVPGVYDNWPDTEQQVVCFSDADFRKFKTEQDAQDYVDGCGDSDSGFIGDEEEAASRFYGVRWGREPGVYYNWPDAKEQVSGFSNADVKRFDTEEEAQDYVGDCDDESAGEDEISCRFYGVRYGRQPGVYYNWSDAEEQVSGYSNADVRRFDTEEEAQDYVDDCRFYGVRYGRQPGVYYNWPDAEEQVSGYSNADFRRFDTEEEAQDYVDDF